MKTCVFTFTIFRLIHPKALDRRHYAPIESLRKATPSTAEKCPHEGVPESAGERREMLEANVATESRNKNAGPS